MPNKKYSKKTAFLILSLVFCILLSACTIKSNTSDGTSTKSDNSANIKQETSNFNAQGYPVVNEPIIIKIVAKHDIGKGQYKYGDMQLFKEISQKTNVQIEWEEIASSAFEEKKSLIFASGDLPDAFWGEGMSDSDILINKDFFIPLNDLIDKYAVNIKKVFEKRPETKRSITASDGNIYSLFRVRELYFPAGRTTWGINKKWLDKLGLEVPETTEEFYNVLKAFKTGDPNGNNKQDEIPFIFHHAMGSGSVRSEADLYPAFGVYDNTSNNELTYHLMMRDGKVIFTPMDEGYKEALKFLNRLYAEDLLDKEVFTTDSSTYYAKTRSEEDIVGVVIDWTIDSAVGVERAKNDFVQLGALKGPKGHQGWGIVSGSQIGRHMFEITTKNKYPEATIRWVDEFYSPENSVQAFYGPIGEMIKREGDKLIALEPPEGMSYGSWKWGRTCADSGAYAALSEYSSFFVPPEQQVGRARAEEYVAKYLLKEPYPNIFFSIEDVAALKKIIVDINAFVETSRAQFVTEGNIDQKWDEYVKQLEKMKINDALAILQRAYEQYMKNN